MEMSEILEEFFGIGNRFGKMRYEVLFHDISRREYEMLVVISRYMEENEGTKGIYISRLANLLHVSSPAVSRMAGMLEDKGYIQRDVDKEDRRNTYVYMTLLGFSKKADTELVMQDILKKVILRMGEKNIQEMLRLWNQLANIMEEEIKASDV